MKKRDEIIKLRISDLKNNFKPYMDYFKENYPFSGPSEYFYIKIINTIKSLKDNKDYDKLFEKDFIELLYATLCSWGMHRMGPDNKGPKMNEFSKFKDCIIANKDKFKKILLNLRTLASNYNEFKYIFPLHPNPIIREPAYNILNNTNIRLIEPMDYDSFLKLIKLKI